MTHAAGESRAMSTQHACPAAEDLSLSGIRLRCPRCGTGIDELDCPACRFAIVIDDGIAHALPPESIAHHARFMEDYERIRASEGRGSESCRLLPRPSLPGYVEQEP